MCFTKKNVIYNLIINDLTDNVYFKVNIYNSYINISKKVHIHVLNGTSKFTHRQNIIKMGENPNKSAVEMSLPLHEKTRYNTCLHDKDLYRCFFKLKWSDEIMHTITRKYDDNPII